MAGKIVKMASKKVVYNKSDLCDYVSGKLNIKSQLVETSALKAYSASEQISLYPQKKLVYFTCALILTGFIILNRGPQSINFNDSMWWLGVICFAMGLVNVRLFFSAHHSNTLILKTKLKEPVEELCYLKDYLISYLRSLDSRTSKYFNVITNNKVSNYLLLLNIKLALQDKISEIDLYAEKLSPTNLIIIDKLVRGGLEVRDGGGLDPGNLNLISFSKVAETIDTLVSNMESSVRDLEEELRIVPENLEY
jgi:hypothetical protein